MVCTDKQGLPLASEFVLQVSCTIQVTYMYHSIEVNMGLLGLASIVDK